MVAGIIAVVAYDAGRCGSPASIVEVVRNAIATRSLPEPTRPPRPQALVDSIRQWADENKEREAEHQAALPHPGFSLKRAEEEFGTGWEITNEEETPLTINMVAYNGEWKAYRGKKVLISITVDSPPPPYPVMLGIGASETFVHVGNSGMFAGCERYSYDREVIFVDVYTDRGNFRFRDEQVTDEAPAFDETRWKAVEAESIAKGDAADAARKNNSAWPGVQTEEQKAAAQRAAGGGGNPNTLTGQ
jgi:hypothetical protein